MIKIKRIFYILVFFVFSVTYAHKDRFESPQKFIFVLKSKKVIHFNSTDSKLEEFCHEIVRGKKDVIEVQLFYQTGEIITIKSNGINWNLFKIAFKGKSLYIPQYTLKKISQIHFSTLCLVWSGERDAFNSSYFYFVFDVGRKTNFGKLPHLKLFFEDQKFFKSVIWKQISENSSQEKDF